MLTLLELLTLEFAAKDRAALRINPVGEELAGDADAVALPVLQLSVVDVLPLLHRQYTSSTNVLAQVRVVAQALLFLGPHIHICGEHCLIPPLPLQMLLRQPAILEDPCKY